MKMQIESTITPFIIYATPDPDLVPRMVEWLATKSTYAVDVVIIHDGRNKNLVSYIKDYHLKEVIVTTNFKMADIGSLTINCPKYFFYVDVRSYPIEKCPNNLLSHMVAIYEKYPFVHKVSCYLEKTTSKQTKDKVAYIGNASTKFALYRNGYSDFKIGSSDLTTKQPYRVSDSPNSKSSTIQPASISCKLTGREFSYITRTNQLSLSFISNTECVLSDGSKGDVDIKNTIVTIKWRSISKGVTTIVFDDMYVSYKGSNNRLGPIYGMISNAVGNPTLRDQLFKSREKEKIKKKNAYDHYAKDQYSLKKFVGDVHILKHYPIYTLHNYDSELFQPLHHRQQTSPKLSILVCSVEERRELLFRLLYRLAIQLRDTEVLINIDDSFKTIGQKRNELLDQSRGEYVCFIDDDDLVSFNYIDKVMHALLTEPDCCGMEGIMTTNGLEPKKFIHSNKYKKWFEQDGVYYRNPNHLCPIKRSIAVSAKFPLVNHGEDRIFSEAIRPLLKKESYIDNPIYYYLFRRK